MITNERQYKITRSEADRFRNAISDLAKGPARLDVHPRLLQAEREAMEGQLADLRAELAEYDRLKSADLSVISINSFDELADGLIKARIASGLSQKTLAERLGLKEQQNSNATRPNATPRPAISGCARSPARSACASGTTSSCRLRRTASADWLASCARSDLTASFSCRGSCRRLTRRAPAARSAARTVITPSPPRRVLCLSACSAGPMTTSSVRRPSLRRVSPPRRASRCPPIGRVRGLRQLRGRRGAQGRAIAAQG